MVLAGDAWMRPEDAERASEIMSVSLAQFVDAASGVGVGAQLITTEVPTLEPDTFDVARNTVHLSREFDPAAIQLFAETLLETPSPRSALAWVSSPGSAPNWGPFVGFAPPHIPEHLAADLGKIRHTLELWEGWDCLARRVRDGGIINEAGDGLVFLDLGVRQDAASSENITGSEALEKYGAITAMVPARSAYTARLRLPFWLIPGDLILAALVYAPFSPLGFMQMAVTAEAAGSSPGRQGSRRPWAGSSS